MRQLKGKVKESAREKKERKKEFMENKEKLFTVALPALGAVFLLVVVFVYMSTRPQSVIEGWEAFSFLQNLLSLDGCDPHKTRQNFVSRFYVAPNDVFLMFSLPAKDYHV